MDQIIVHLIDIATVRNQIDFIISSISQERIDKANRFLKEEDRLLSLGAAYLIFKYLPKKEIIFNENHKPYINDGPYFNISHSGQYACLIISMNKEIGLDLQKIEENNLPAIKSVSKEQLPLKEMFQLWANKESLIKCLGSNVSIIKDVPGTPLIGLRQYQNKPFYTVSIIFSEYALSVTRKDKTPFEIKLQLEE